MITVDQAIEITNNYKIDFPSNWKEQMMGNVETAIKAAASKGKRMCNIQGSVSPHTPGQGYGYGQLFLNPDQFSEVIGEIKKAGFKVEEDLRIRFDGRPLTIDVFWGI